MNVLNAAGVTQRQLHKFGGSSLADASCYQRVATIMAEYSQPGDLMVVSAAGNTTDLLIEWLTISQQDKIAALQVQQTLRNYQLDLITSLLPQTQASELAALLVDDLLRLSALLDSPVTEAIYADLVGQGEIWSARLMTALLQHQEIAADWLDARLFLRAERCALPQVDEGSSWPLLHNILAQYHEHRLVITGFISRNLIGETVLLGRNGSDYSATQIGALAGVQRVTIWSDVPGVYSADPHKIDDACLLPLLRLDEASELARLAAPVLHSRMLQPVANSDIDLYLRSSLQPLQGATRIERILASGSGAKIVTSHDDICLLDVMIDTGHDFEHFQQELQASLKRLQIEPLALNIAADQQILQLCYTAEQVNDTLRFFNQADLPCSVGLRKGFSLVAMVGAGVGNNPLHSHRFYQHVKHQPVEFIWHAETAISLVAVLRGMVSNDLIKELHQSLFKAERHIGLVLFGKGNIGSRWLELFAHEQKNLSERTGFDFILAGVVNSQLAWLDNQGIAVRQASSHFAQQAKPYEKTELFNWMRNHPFDDLVVLDVTASEILADFYLEFARYGFHVISANKIAGASSRETYRQICDAFAKTNRYWLYNATVGAGLPVNYTIRDLCNSGDTILSISGIFSGTLSWLFLQFDGTVPFIHLVEQAWQQGLTEPDPRVDLSGQDVMRKLLILAREAGYDLETEQIKVDSLVPEAFLHHSIEHFFEHAELLNEKMLELFDNAQQSGKVLRYVARFDATSQKATVQIEAVEQSHPLASLLPCDNVFAIESRWYRDNPLVIRGPGAGRDVTAGAIQSDLNRLGRLL